MPAKTNIPSFITHYYVADRPPFLSLSEVEGGSNSPIFANLQRQHKQDSRYHRRFGNDYLDTRKRVETELRRRFIARGGKPIRQYPFYFVLGNCSWFKHLVPNQHEVKIELCNLNAETTSFTFPDSYIALSRASKPYHNRVFLIHELEDFVDQYGLPKDDISKDELSKEYEKYWQGDFEKYIEFQIWEDEVVQPFRCSTFYE